MAERKLMALSNAGLLQLLFLFTNNILSLLSSSCPSRRLQTNTFQMVLATDEVYTYVIFNYAVLNWLSHTEAGGDTTKGEGGVPAFVSLANRINSIEAL